MEKALKKDSNKPFKEALIDKLIATSIIGALIYLCSIAFFQLAEDNIVRDTLDFVIGIVAGILNIMYEKIPSDTSGFLKFIRLPTVLITVSSLVIAKWSQVIKLFSFLFGFKINKKLSSVKGTPNKRYTGESYKPGLPPLSLLGKLMVSKENIAQADRMKKKLSTALQELNIAAAVTDYEFGPTITKYYVSLSSGVRIGNIRSLIDDIAICAGVDTITLSTIKGSVCFEITNEEKQLVTHREVLEELRDKPLKELSIPIGRLSNGFPYYVDLEKAAHMLVAGATNMGKSVTLNDIIVSLIVRHSPDTLKFVMIDPKRVELASYAPLPHLLMPICKEPEKGVEALQWLCKEMDHRYEVLEKQYPGTRKLHDIPIEKRPFPLVICIIDELADLIMTAGKDTESYIVRLAQKARAAGIHLVLATQRPDATILTGLIRSNIPGRIAMKTESGVSSKIILDVTGAEELAGEGEGYAKMPGTLGLVRFQGSFIKDDQVEAVVNWWAKNYKKPVEMVDLETNESYQEDISKQTITAFTKPSDNSNDMEEIKQSPETALRRSICEGVLETTEDTQINLPTLKEMYESLNTTEWQVRKILTKLEKENWIEQVLKGTKNSKTVVSLEKDEAKSWLENNKIM